MENTDRDIENFSKEMNKSFEELYLILYFFIGVTILLFLVGISIITYLICKNKEKKNENLKMRLLLKNGEPILLSDLEIKS